MRLPHQTLFCVPALFRGKAQRAHLPPSLFASCSDDEEDGLSPPAGGARRRITLSGEGRLGRGATDGRATPLLPEAPAPGVSYTQRMRERYTGEAPQRLSPARPRRLTPEALLGGQAAQASPPSKAACSLM